MDFTDADRVILDELREGARTQSFLVDETGYSRQHVHNRLRIMEGAGYVNKLHDQSALWELVEDPFTENTNGDAVNGDDAE